MDLGRALGLAPGALEAGAMPGVGAGAGGGQGRNWQATELAMPAMPATELAGAAAAGAAAAVIGTGSPAAGSPAGPAGPPAGLAGPPTQYQQGQFQQAQFQAPQQPAQYNAPQYTAPQHQPPYQTGYPPQQYQPSQPPPKKGRGLLIGLVAGVLVVAIAAVGLVLAGVIGGKHGGNPDSIGSSTPPSSSSPPSSSPASSSPPPAQSASGQAAAVSSLLKTSEATRGKLGPAVSEIQDYCSSLTSTQLASEVSTIQTVANQRQGEYNQAQTLQVSLLRNGGELRTDLLNALQYSLNADNDYLQWAQQEQQGCFPASQSQPFNAAANADVQAVNAKTSFANLWNGVAPQYGQPTVNQGQI
jgi:hypothetical protein